MSDVANRGSSQSWVLFWFLTGLLIFIFVEQYSSWFACGLSFAAFRTAAQPVAQGAFPRFRNRLPAPIGQLDVRPAEGRELAATLSALLSLKERYS